MIISLCGKSGSGKSTVSKEINKLKTVIHCDIDKIGHNIYSNLDVLNELVKCFGENIVKNGEVDRKTLGNIVFNSKEEMEKLTNITWKYMEYEIDKIINDNKDKIVILDWLLLPKTKYFEMSDIRVLLDIPYEVRKKRAMLRDNISSEDFDLREKASIEYDKDKFDIVLKNSNKSEKDRLVKFL